MRAVNVGPFVWLWTDVSGLSIYHVYKYLVKFKRAKGKNTPVQPQEALTGSLVTTFLLCFVKTAELTKNHICESTCATSTVSQGT